VAPVAEEARRPPTAQSGAIEVQLIDGQSILFIFRSRRDDTSKIRMWDRDGFHASPRTVAGQVAGSVFSLQ
jgi:hypothetical protein